MSRATCDQAEIDLDLSHQFCSARFNGLMSRGLIADHGVRLPTRTGRAAVCWYITPAGIEALAEAIR